MVMLIGYLRVSTNKQHVSGLGLEAQQSAIDGYACRIGDTVAQTFIEAESGSLKHRPQLHAALALCKRKKATLVIAKLDRLARNVAFVSSLMEAGVDFVAVDAPYANRLMIHILSAFAEHEREQISERTKAALSAAKKRGVKLGRHGKVLARQNRQAADEFATMVQPDILGAIDAGASSLRSIAIHLNERGVQTMHGLSWHPMTVSRVIQRLDISLEMISAKSSCTLR